MTEHYAVSRGAERRQHTRRTEDARAWYAAQTLLAVALEYADIAACLNVDPDSAMGRLKAAAANYRVAERAAVTS